MKSMFLGSWFALTCSMVSAAPVATSFKKTVSPLSSKIQSNLEVYGDTSNELSLCRPVTVIYARGTIEFGNIGSFAGPAFFTALGEGIGSANLGVQGVPYAASIIGYLEGGDPAGAAMFAQYADQAAAECPDTQIVLAGYSQGAMMVHLGAAQIQSSTAARVKAVVMFGDPFDGRSFDNLSENIVDTYCFSWDLICYDTIVVDAYHLLYSIDAVPAANFVAGLVSV